MPPAEWTDRLAGIIRRYDESLVRKVAGRLVRPRNQWPVEDLIARCLETLENPAVLDRRIAELGPASRQVLALIGHSRQPTWALGNVVEMTMALGHADGLVPILDLLEAGLLFPVIEGQPAGEERRGSRMFGFDYWLGTAGTAGLEVHSPPQVAVRAIGTDLGLPLLERGSKPVEGAASLERPPLPAHVPVQESDGLEWLLRLGVLWQQVAAAPLRRTQQGGLFKRDVDRIGQDPLLNGPPPDRLAEVPDLGFWLTVMAEQDGILREVDGELKAGTLPGTWDQGLWPALESLWRSLFRTRTWSPLDGWRGGEEIIGNPFPSAYLLGFLLLARLPGDGWITPRAIEEWLQTHHPFWTNETVRPSRQKPWLETFLLGLAYPMRVVQVAKTAEEGYLVRLGPAGRWLLGLGEMPAPPTTFPRTLLVQPNLEILAYRQGLTPGLIGRLSRLAAWKTLGAACTLQLEPETVYRALELGETFDTLCRTLEQHGTRAMPPAVLDSLRTWSNKRDRITIFPAAALLEFNSAADLEEALARGLPAVRIGDTLAVVASEDQIEFRHFRLAGTRDYALPPDRCVTIDADGVTLSVDLARSDLMLETELPRFAELVDRAGANGKRQYRLTPASLARARAEGMTLSLMDTWFQQRTGQATSPAARLLLTGSEVARANLRTHLVLHVDLPEIADGLMQWPTTRALIAERLGPTSLSVDAEKLEALKQRLDELGMRT